MSMNETLDDMAVRLAVTEQLALEIAALLARSSDDPPAEVVGLADDLRDRFAPSPGDGSAMKTFKVRAQAHVGLLEQRLRMLLGR